MIIRDLSINVRINYCFMYVETKSNTTHRSCICVLYNEKTNI